MMATVRIFAGESSSETKNWHSGMLAIENGVLYTTNQIVLAHWPSRTRRAATSKHLAHWLSKTWHIGTSSLGTQALEDVMQVKQVLAFGHRGRGTQAATNN